MSYILIDVKFDGEPKYYISVDSEEGKYIVRIETVDSSWGKKILRKKIQVSTSKAVVSCICIVIDDARLSDIDIEYCKSGDMKPVLSMERHGIKNIKDVKTQIKRFVSLL